MTQNENSKSEPSALLEKAVRAFESAETLCFKARKVHGVGFIKRFYDRAGLRLPYVKQKYWRRNTSAASYVRTESTADFGGRSLTTIFIKNRDGIWDVLDDFCIDVSSIFRRDQLPATFPMLRFFLASHYPYELSIAPSSDPDQVVLRGSLTAPPLSCDEDLAKEFTYLISKRDTHLRSLQETTLSGRSIHLEMEEVSINQPLDRGIFMLPVRPKITPSTIEDYITFRTHHTEGTAR